MVKQKTELDYFDFSQEPGKDKIIRPSKYVEKIFISVITKYNGKKEIEQTYNSLANQTFPHWEWLITTTQIDETLKTLQNKDNRIKIIKKNVETMAKAQYDTAKLASSELLLLLAEGDLIDKTMLECGYFTMLNNPQGVWAYSSMIGFGAKNSLINEKLDIYKMTEKNMIPKCAFIRKEKLLEIKDFKDLPRGVYEDWYLWLYFLSKKYTPIKMDFYGYWNRRTLKNNENEIKENQEKLEISKKYMNQIKKEIKKGTDTIQFHKIYQMDFKDIPKKIEITSKDIFEHNNRKRILIIAPWFVVGGGDIFTLNLIKGLRERGYEISVITTKKCDYILRPEVEKYVDEYFDLTTFLKEKDWASFIHHIVKSRNIQLVLITNSFYGYYALPWLKYQLKQIPFVDYIHAENFTLRNGGFPKDSNSVASFLDETYTCTKHLKEIMYTMMNRHVKNIKTVYIGTDTTFYDRNIKFEGEEELKEKYKGKKVILFIGRMVHYKRPLFAIEVLKELLKKDKNIKLIIVGDGADYKDVKSKIKEEKLENNIDLYGMQDDVRKFYKVADVTLVCSLREGLTLTTYESLSMGVPVVSSDIGGQKEIIEEDCGFLIRPYQMPNEQFDFNYSPEEIKEYAESIKKVFEKDDYKEICRKKVIEKFSIKKMITNMDNKITKLIKKGSSVDGKLCNNIEFAERYLLVNGMLESLNRTIEMKKRS